MVVLLLKTDVKGVGDFLGKLVKSAVTNETAVKYEDFSLGTIKEKSFFGR